MVFFNVFEQFLIDLKEIDKYFMKIIFLKDFIMEQKMNAQNFYKFFSGLLLAIVAFLGSQLYLKVVQMNKDLIEIKMTLVKIQSQELTRESVKELIDIELNKRIKESAFKDYRDN